MASERSSGWEHRVRISRRLRRFDSRYFKERGIGLLGGVDEAGRGALAGPVVAAAVVLDPKCHIAGVNDSKQLTPDERKELYSVVCSKAIAVAIGYCSAREIDQINILQASILASKRALHALRLKPELLLTDALKMDVPGIPIEPLIKGDARSQAIAAASIIAKVTRDRWMRELDREFPLYGFAAHKGYGVEMHMEALKIHGSSTIHRHTFRGVDWFEDDYRTSLEFERMRVKLEETLVVESDALEGLEYQWPVYLPECEIGVFREMVNKRLLDQRSFHDMPD
jgi:ribonuclease HII